MIKLMSLKYSNSGNYVIIEYGTTKKVCIGTVCSDELPEIQRLMPKVLWRIANSSYREVTMYLGIGKPGSMITLEIEKQYEKDKPRNLRIMGVIGITVLFRVEVGTAVDEVYIYKKDIKDEQVYHQVINNPVIKHLITTTIMEMMR